MTIFLYASVLFLIEAIVEITTIFLIIIKLPFYDHPIPKLLGEACLARDILHMLALMNESNENNKSIFVPRC